MSVRLTQYSHGAGCACKLGPSDLADVLARLQSVTDPALLVGYSTGDDAAAYRLDQRTAIIFTTDFFTPIVDDAYDWGRIAAANALSDVYAMGGRPLLCLNIAGWPRDDLPLDLLGEVLAGGAAIAHEAGALVAGGHTIDDREPKYGMAAVGIADPAHIVTNAGARPGDELVLTKPLGLGVISTAMKRGRADLALGKRAIEVMATLNATARDVMLDAGAQAATDVTGFGLLGHLRKVCAASNVAAEVRAPSVPVMDGVRELVAEGMISGGSKRNRVYVDEVTTYDDDVAEDDRVILSDAQTSGGLLIATQRAPDVVRALAERGCDAAIVGRITQGTPGTLRVTR